MNEYEHPAKIRLPTNDNLRTEILRHLKQHPVDGIEENVINKLYDGKRYRVSPDNAGKDTKVIEVQRMAAEEAAEKAFSFPNKKDITYTGSDFVMVELCKDASTFPFSTDYSPYENPFSDLEPGDTCIFDGVDKKVKVKSLKIPKDDGTPEPRLSILGPNGLTYENMRDEAKGKLKVAVEYRFVPFADYLFRHEKAKTGCDFELDPHVRSLEGFVMRNRNELTREDLAHLAVDVAETLGTAGENDLALYREVVPTYLVLLKVFPKNGNGNGNEHTE